MATSDAFKRGKSGFSVKDEKDSKTYSANEVKRSKQAGIPAKEVAARGRTSKTNYLENVKTEKGRGYNASNVKTMKEDLSKKLAGKRI